MAQDLGQAEDGPHWRGVVGAVVSPLILGPLICVYDQGFPDPEPIWLIVVGGVLLAMFMLYPVSAVSALLVWLAIKRWPRLRLAFWRIPAFTLISAAICGAVGLFPGGDPWGLALVGAVVFGSIGLIYCLIAGVPWRARAARASR